MVVFALTTALFIGLHTAIWLGIYYKVAARSVIGATVGCVVVALVMAGLSAKGSEAFGGVVAGSIVGWSVARGFEWRQRRREAVAAAAEQQRLLDEQERSRRRLEAENVEQERHRQEELREAERLRVEREAQRARSREERERSGAHHALRSHFDVMTSAVRSLRAGDDNAVLLNTIDNEIKAIARNERITEAMLGDPEIRYDVGVVLEMMSERGVNDKLLLARIRKVFRVDA